MSDTTQAKWDVGQLVHHRLFDYRGVVYDVDPVFMLSDEWYELVAKSRPPRDEPWYRVLVDGSAHETYVAQRNLEADETSLPIEHPMIEEYFSAFKQGRYQTRRSDN